MQKILVVEDDPSTQDFICEILKDFGYEIATAGDGDGCFDQLRENPDTKLVLLDIMLPGKSGWDIFSDLRKSRPDLKVMFVSAVEVSSERRESLQKSGLVDYIVKPFTEDVLQGAVKKALS